MTSKVVVNANKVLYIVATESHVCAAVTVVGCTVAIRGSVHLVNEFNRFFQSRSLEQVGTS